MLIDALCALFILSMAATALYSVMPEARASDIMAADQAKATFIANRYIEQLQLLKTTDLTATTLSQMNLIDTGQAALPYSFTNIPLDDGSYYSPAKMLKAASATVNFTNIDSASVRADITISWKTPHNVTRTLSTGTIVGGYK